MDIIFNCPQCGQELAVDSGGAGSEITCPACSETITIPAQGAPRPETGAIPAAHVAGAPGSAMASSAAAKIEMHLKVPLRDAPTESLVKGGPKPLEVIAKGADRQIRVKTIRHTDCIEVGHDKFDEFVSLFLTKVGEANIVSISPLTYTNLDIGSQKLMTEYAVMIVYKG
jgi:DNA-directed RNA polymerase subunit RPC12/RpoP